MNFYEVALIGRALEPLTYHHDETLQLGMEVLVTVRNKSSIKGVVVCKVDTQPSFKTVAIQSITGQYYSEFMMQIGQFIADYYVCYFGQAIALFHPFSATFNQPTHDEVSICDTIVLSSMQTKALHFIDQHPVSLLFADTGSGKTEIYIKQILKTLQKSEQSLLLMPEISLTPQMEKRLQIIFGNSIAIWHSKVAKKKKAEILQGVQNGTIKIVAGARSALFLPFLKLGLIIVDEEHDESYKADNSPMFNAKDLAIYIGSKYNIQVILGSATPSCTTYHKVKHFRLKETFFDTTKQYFYDEASLSVNNFILNKIIQKLQDLKQVIVFLPTRANFRYQICESCGKAVECPFCSVSMSLHKNQKALKCHYCGYTAAIFEKCPHCEHGIIKNFRMGTAEVESFLKEKLTNYTVQKFDRDSIGTEKELKKVLSAFNNKEIDVLVGTQMLSKGHDYHNVTLSVILGIDSVLSMCSYRAREKAVSLLVQLSGRSGRNGHGEVIIQTSNKLFFEPFLEDYELFLEDELAYRAKLYPPFVRIAKIYFSHHNHITAKKNMDLALAILENEQIEIIGYGESFVFKVANKYRYEIFVRSVAIKKLLNALHFVKHLGSIDMDCLE